MEKLRMIGILAYGSLIDDPGGEIEPYIIKRIEIETPFPVEFARSSRTRDGAPTLVPVSQGGSTVHAVILVLDREVSESQARDMLWRREIGLVDGSQGYNPPANPNKNSVIVEELIDFEGVDTVFYTKIGQNIEDLTPKTLAKLSIESARKNAGLERRDGITYLINAKNNGIRTPLMQQYESEILRLTEKKTLELAREALVDKKNV